MHDIQDLHLWKYHRKHGRDNGKIFCNIIRNTKCGQRSSGDQKLFSDFHHFQNLGRLCSGIHCQTNICLCQRRSIVCTVTCHGNHFSFCLLFFDRLNFIFRFTFCNKTVNSCFLRNRCCCQRIITGTHDCLDSDFAKSFKTLHQSWFYCILLQIRRDDSACFFHKSLDCFGSSFSDSGSVF